MKKLLVFLCFSSKIISMDFDPKKIAISTDDKDFNYSLCAQQEISIEKLGDDAWLLFKEAQKLKSVSSSDNSSGVELRKQGLTQAREIYEQIDDKINFLLSLMVGREGAFFDRSRQQYADMKKEIVRLQSIIQQKINN